MGKFSATTDAAITPATI